MYTGLNLFKMASALAHHSSQSQQAVARNIANADTPGYRAVEPAPFSESYKDAGDGLHLRARRAGHFVDPLPGLPRRPVANSASGNLSPNGNDISLESEMMKASEIRQHHSLALSVYRGGLDLLRAGLGR